MSKKYLNTTILGGFILLLLSGLVLASIIIKENNNSEQQNNIPEGTVCTMDAKMCPDGTYVGRTGPNCEFVCPAVGSNTSTTTSEKKFQAKLNQQSLSIYSTVTPIEVLEDSRCPTDVQCIQAGTVRLKVLVISPSGQSTNILKIGDSMSTESEVITFLGVSPTKISTININPSTYLFQFRSVSK